MRRADIRELTTHDHYPSASILMPTHRAHPENQQDPVRLKNLLKEVRDRLTEELGKRPSWPLMDRLETLEVDWRLNEDALVLYASDDFAARYRLPFRVEERVAVGRSFYTRDVLYSLHRMPRYRVLSLAERPTRLFEGSGKLLEEVRSNGFPIQRSGPGGLTRRPDAPQMARSGVREAYLLDFFREVDRALAEIAAHDPLPLVLIGTPQSLSTFEEVTNGSRVAVRIEGSHDEVGPAAIAELAWPRFEEWLHAERHAVLEEVGPALGARRLATGLDDVWKAAHAGQGAKLVVEEGYRQPAIVRRDGWELELVTDRDPAADGTTLDDAVDELIEAVLDKGGEVVFVDEGTLSDYDRVALILRY